VLGASQRSVPDGELRHPILEFVEGIRSPGIIVAKIKFSIFRRAEEVALNIGHPAGAKPKLGPITRGLVPSELRLSSLPYTPTAFTYLRFLLGMVTGLDTALPLEYKSTVTL